jgi:SAM-dependent methyltransferase
MRDKPAYCPICSGKCQRIRAWGGQGFHSLNTIAGIQVDDTRKPFSLYQCQDCRFIFKTPRLSDQQLLNLYAQSVDRAYETEASLNKEGSDDHDPLGRLCEKTAENHTNGRRVLEIGCSNGRMLRDWGSEWDKYGVEPSDAATKIAEKRGIKIMAKTIDELANNSSHHKWDCILSVDTIEHVSDPLRFISISRQLLAPNGVIIILTGNMSCPLARFAGARYWYASFPEHISFPTPQTFQYIANSLRGRVMRSRPYRWARGTENVAVTWVIQAFKYTVFTLLLILSRLRGSRLPQRGFPVMTSHRDHIMTVLGQFG